MPTPHEAPASTESVGFDTDSIILCIYVLAILARERRLGRDELTAAFSLRHFELLNDVVWTMTSSEPTSTREPTADMRAIKGEHALKLEELNYTGDIPEIYACNLTNEIMTNPMRDPNKPAYVFERGAILKALEMKAVNPFTQTDLNPADLVLDVKLKNNIEIFMENIEEMQHFMQSSFRF